MAAPSMTKNQMRRARKKELKKAKEETPASEIREEALRDEAAKAEMPAAPGSAETARPGVKQTTETDPAAVDGLTDDINPDDETYKQFKSIFERFGTDLEKDEVQREANAGIRGEVFMDDDDDIPDEDKASEQIMSKKKRKKLMKLSIAELKALVKNPEIVDWQDVSSSDPRLLVQIKATRNIVPVPSHWSLKREYLSSKRGIEKPPFKLPKFIADTGIAEMRDAVNERAAEQSLKQKQREKVQPKMGRMDIDYSKLYDAFFKHQTKPLLSGFGEAYYEGKEAEADWRVFKPGDISEGLREALGMAPGYPPPWLLQMQRVGPPPSYPALKIPGLNAPLPPGASWGFQPGQWGKPPLDEYNRPLYGGDVFGIMAGQAGGPGQPTQAAQVHVGEAIERTLWGELQPPAEESDEEESGEEEGEDEETADVAGGTATNTGLETPSGYASTVLPDPSGVETSMAGEFDLRKKARPGYETEESSYGGPRSAFTVIPERQGRVEGFFGSDKRYDLPTVPVLGQDDDSNRKRKKPGDVDVALDPDQLMARGGLNKEELRKQYEAGRREQGPGAQWTASHDEDLTDMIREESRKRMKRDEDKRADKRDKTRR